MKPVCFSLIHQITHCCGWVWRGPGGSHLSEGKAELGMVEAALWSSSRSPFWAGVFGLLSCSETKGCRPLSMSESEPHSPWQV